MGNFETGEFFGIIGRSPSMRELYSLIEKVAPSTASILIQGESGTGKELVARAIHKLSERSQKPFLAINCAAIPSELLESELFGHVKGAYTGAHADHQGIFEACTGGTIFLDEIGDMPLVLQSKLLRVLQDSKVRPVGSNDEITVDVRIIAATHQNLIDLVHGRQFREDLYFRLNVIPLAIPPMRDRLEDFPCLVNHFIQKFNHLHGKSVTGISQNALESFATYTWPGNVRELENSIERAVLLAGSSELGSEDFSWIPTARSSDRGRPVASEFHSAVQNGVFRIPLGVSLKELEERYILAYCEAHRGLSQEEVASGLGINRKTLYRKFQEVRSASATN